MQENQSQSETDLEDEAGFFFDWSVHIRAAGFTFNHTCWDKRFQVLRVESPFEVDRVQISAALNMGGSEYAI